MKNNTMKVSREQMGILQHLDRASVRYLAVGDFAMLAIDPARMLQQAKLWIDPARENLQRLNQALRNAFGARTTRQVDPDTASDRLASGLQLSLGVGLFRVGFYFGIGGFKPDEFGQVYQRSVTEQASIPGQKGELPVRRLANEDLIQQLKTEQPAHGAWNLEQLQNIDSQVGTTKNAAVRDLSEHKGQNVPYAPRGLYFGPKEEQTNRQIPSELADKKHKGHFVPYDVAAVSDPVKSNRNLTVLRQKLDLEAVLDYYGFKPETTQKANEPWRIYSRTVDGDSQRMVVATLKETSQKQFYQIDKRGFKGDVLDLIAGLEPYLNANDTSEQRVFRMTDQWLSTSSTEKYNREDVPPLRPISSAYFNGTGANLREQNLLDEQALKPLTKTAALESMSITKATAYAPEFVNCIRNVPERHPQSGQAQSMIAFPLTDPMGKIVDVATSQADRPELFVQQAIATDQTNALWQSNRFYQTRTDVPVMGGEAIPAGTIGVGSRQEGGQFTFHYRDNEQERAVLLPVQEAKQMLREQLATSLVIAQSPMDALSVKQLNPEQAGDRRLYVATVGAPTTEQTARIEQLVQKNPKARLVLTTNQDVDSYRAAINLLGVDHPAADAALRVRPEIKSVAASDERLPMDREVARFFYPPEPTLRTENDLLYRFGYHAYSQSPDGQVGLALKHLQDLLAGRQGIISGTTTASTFSDNLALNAIGSALLYADVHKVPLSDQFRAVRDTPVMKAWLQAERRDMQRVYQEEGYGGKNQLTLELRQPANQSEASKHNDAFLNRFITTLAMTANQLQAKTNPQSALDSAMQTKRTVQEMNRQTYLDPQQGQVVTRSSIVLPNDVSVLGKATQLLANEINERQGQRLIQVLQPGPNHKTMGEMLVARQGQPLPDRHRSNMGGPEPIRPPQERTQAGEQKSVSLQIGRPVAEQQVKESTSFERNQVAARVG